MEEKYTASETYMLPSKAMIYDETFDPMIRLRSMTTREEMKRLSHTETPYKMLCEIIDDCIVGKKPPISSYDMYIGDYQFLLQKLRVATYGPDYKLKTICSNCGEFVDINANLDELEIKEYDGSFEDARVIKLPVSEDEIELRLQTPRVLDNISLRTKEMKKKMKNYTTNEVGLLVTLEALIFKINGNKTDPLTIGEYIKNMPMKDTNYLLQKAQQFNEKVGIDNTVKGLCAECGEEIRTSFRITPEFFGPDIEWRG